MEPNPQYDCWNGSSIQPAVQWSSPPIEPAVELSSSHECNFFEEAGCDAAACAKIRELFDRISQGTGVVTRERFCFYFRLRRLCNDGEEIAFFRAMDRQKAGHLDFDAFKLGCVAAHPECIHILNSYTGEERCRFIFDFYNASESGTLTFEELSQLLRARNLGMSDDDQHQCARDVAQTVGAMELFDLHIQVGFSGAKEVVQVSKQWSWASVKCELADVLGIPKQEQELLLGDCLLKDRECVHQTLGELESPELALVTLIRSCTAQVQNAGHALDMPKPHERQAVRLAHVSFDAFYDQVRGEHLRRTSCLFRLRLPRGMLRFREGGA